MFPAQFANFISYVSHTVQKEETFGEERKLRFQYVPSPISCVSHTVSKEESFRNQNKIKLYL
jgi:hypothetical protein